MNTSLIEELRVEAGYLGSAKDLLNRTITALEAAERALNEANTRLVYYDDFTVHADIDNALTLIRGEGEGNG